jgi:hypothetical protein
MAQDIIVDMLDSGIPFQDISVSMSYPSGGWHSYDISVSGKKAAFVKVALSPHPTDPNKMKVNFESSGSPKFEKAKP